VTGARLPDGFAVRLDGRTRRLDGGAALLGLSSGRLLHLAPAARRLLDAGAGPGGADLIVRDATSARLARRLLDAGVAHPAVLDPGAPTGPGIAEVTVVVPVKDRPDGLRRLLATLAETAPAGIESAPAGIEPARVGGETARVGSETAAVPLAGPGGTTGDAVGLAEVIVVDDGSADPGACRAGVEQSVLGSRVRLIRHPSSRGPAAARNTGAAAAGTALVAFLDSDVVPEPGWLAPLLAHLADPAVALAAPRIAALPPASGAVGWLDRYERLRSSLDLGPDPGPIVPRSRVAYVPSAAMLVRRAALGSGFDEDLHVAEDVDLVLRLHAAGWRLRYEPAAVVAHEHRARPVGWWARKAFYGTGAAPLALRHPGSVPPMVLAPWAAAVCLLVGAQRRSGVLAAAALTGFAWWRLRHTLAPPAPSAASPPAASPPAAGPSAASPPTASPPAAGPPAAGPARLRQPGRVAALLIGLGLSSAANQSAGLLVRHWWPAAALGCLVSGRVRRAVLVAALADGLLDWHRHRPEPGERGLDPVRYVLAHRADDLGYGAGLWWGAARSRTLAPLRPMITGLDRWSHRWPARWRGRTGTAR
jgi:GT2 family glycosyltransferase